MQRNVLRAFFKLVRLEYSLFGALGVFLSGFLAADLHGFQLEYLVAFLIVLFSGVGSFAFNDYYDFDVDTRNNRLDRPLVVGLLSRKSALIAGSIAFFWAVLLSLFLNSFAMFLVLISLPLFFLYSVGLKRIFLVKNALIAYAFVATILFGSLVSNVVLEPLIVYFAIMGFIVGIAYEIMLDMGDVEGDRTLGINTISTKFSLKMAGWVSIVLYIFIIVLDPLPFFVMIDSRLHMDYVFLFLILVPVVSYLFASKSLIQDQSKKNIFKLKKQVFLTMQIGSIAYLIGVLL